MNNAPKNFWSSLNALIAVVIALVAVMIVGGLKVISNIGSPRAQAPSTITVEGTGDALSVPDVATFSFSVMENAKTVTDAQTAATTKINAALASLKSQGVDDKDISTESYTINPHYDYQDSICPVGSTYCPGGKNVMNGYDVSETIQVKVRDLTKAGTIFASIGSLNVDTVNGLDFSIDDPSSVQAAARAKAIADAQSKAQVLAKQLGVSLGSVQSFSENNGGYVQPVMFAMDAKASGGVASAPAPQVPTGEQKVTSDVTITYEIK